MHARFDEMLEAHRDEIAPRDLKLARYMIVTPSQAPVHAAVIDPPAGFDAAAIEAIVDMPMGYLGAAALAVPSAPAARRAPRAIA
ncbi:hypothetical protein [Solimonas soli]|uniref:hypothetical protein n=1 Tax=Solimonas soli TaxID=413479 RepID=UPI00047FC59D|nr:hypothetical protein [Solimonas soli]